MTGALVGAVSCLRCGTPTVAGHPCERCGTAWAPATPATPAPRRPPGTVLPAEHGRSTGVVRAGIGSRALAGLLDVVVVAVPVGLALGCSRVAAGRSGTVLLRVWLAVAIVVIITQVWVLLVRGRTFGRWPTRLRTVDDLSGTPIRATRLGRQLFRSGGRSLTADLGRGSDPWRSRIVPVVLGAGAAAATTAKANPLLTGRVSAGGPTDDDATGPTASAGRMAMRAAVSADRLPAVVAGRPAGIVLDSGERYEVDRPLLIGRNPVDPDGHGERTLLSWADLSRRLATTHLLLERSGTDLSVTDLYSDSGTAVIGNDGRRTVLQPGETTNVPIGALIQCGGRTIKVVPSG